MDVDHAWQFKALWLAIGAGALLLVLGWWLFANDEAARAPSLALPRLEEPAAHGEMPAQPGKPANDAATRVQQLIDSGAFAPPPGNTDKMYSIASPFANAPRTTEPSVPQQAARSDSGPNGPQPNWMARSPTPYDPSNPPNRAPNRPAEKALTPPAPSMNSQLPAPPQPQPSEFETPPGVGSARGGR